MFSILCVLCTCITDCYSQLNEPHRLKIGASFGAGGLHTYVGPSVDVAYHNTTLRVSPGLFFVGIGLSQKAGYFRLRNSRKLYPLVFSFYYLDDYLISDIKKKVSQVKQRRDLDIYMIMAGLHFQFDRLDRHYWELQGGLMYVEEKFYDFDGIPTPSQSYFRPMIEIRIGGILQLHQNHSQKPPKNNR